MSSPARAFRLPAWVIVLAIFTVPAVLSAVLFHTRYLHLGRETVLWKWILDFQLAWYIWAALTPLIIKLARRYRIDQRDWLLPATIHLTIGSILSVIQIFLGVVISIIIYQEPLNWEYVQGQVIPTVIGRFASQLTVYFLIVGVGYALDYQKQSRERALRATSLENELSKARLDALKQQLQPHFLFNTLNSISVLMQKGEITLANKVLNDLSSLLRQVLRKENLQHVSLEEELEFVRRYAEIEQVRYGDRLRVDFDIPSELLNISVPTFILQLLVENAIRHGVAKKADSGKVRITARRIGERLNLTVIDDGVGIDASSFSEGIGISNARDRLQHLYGSAHHFDISNNAGAGVTASVELPIEMAPQIADTHRSANS